MFRQLTSARFILGLLLTAWLLLASACVSTTVHAPPASTVGVAKPAFTPKAAPATAVRKPTPTVKAGPLVVGNTGGDGVWLRRSPDMEDRVRTWPDNSPMQVIGADREVDGRLWKNVEDPAGNVGWIPAEYLVNPEPQPTPQPPEVAQQAAEQSACIKPSRAFVEYLADGLNFAGAGLAGTQAVSINSGGESWYLVSASILGSNRGRSITAYWTTSIDPTAEIAVGTLLSVNQAARDLSVWPPLAGAEQAYNDNHPDVKRALRCLDVSLDR